MKCPSCGYVAFQATDECVACNAPMPPSETDSGLDEASFRQNVRRRKRDQMDFSFPGADEDSETLGDERGGADSAFDFGSVSTSQSKSATSRPKKSEPATSGESSPAWSLDDDEGSGSFSHDDSSFSSGTSFLDEAYAEENTWIEAYAHTSTFGRRAVAMLLDSVFFIILLGLLLFTLGGNPANFAPTNPAVLPAYFFLVILHAFYFTFFHAVTGQTPGKMLCGIRVVAVRGGSVLSPWDSFMRWFGYFLSGAPLGAGFLWTLLDPDDRGWHDKWAHSVVVELAPAMEDSSPETGQESEDDATVVENP